MNPRQLLSFLKGKTGQVVAFGLLFLIGATLLTGILYFRSAAPSVAAHAPSAAPAQLQALKSWFSGKPAANFANQPPGSTPTPTPHGPTTATEDAATVLPLSLYHSSVPEAGLSDTYAPYGRLIPCETVITIDSAKIETPIIGFVTEDVWHDGKLIIPAGAEVHGKAQVDPSRERIASDTSWVLVWRTSDRMNGAELPLKGTALDRERNERTGTWQLTDGSAGLRGDILKTDNWAEIKLFAATFLSAATTGLEDTQTSSNALTGQRPKARWLPRRTRL